MNLGRFYRHAQQLTLVALRGITTVVKFALALYTARYLGLADLGVYGLLVGASTIVPACLGFGVTDLLSRTIAGLGLREAMPYMTSRLALTLAAHLVGQPLVYLANAALGAPIPWTLLLPVGLILVLEHLMIDAQDMLIYRGRVYLASVLFFIRSGLWPPVIIAWGLLDPTARSLGHILMGWLGALVVAWIVLLLHLLPHARWRMLGLRPTWLILALRSSVPFYIKDIAGVISLFLDRFLVSLFLGLELTGVYTFFWSVANVVPSLVSGVVQTHATALIQAARQDDSAVFRKLERRLQIDILCWAGLLSAAAIIATPQLLPFLDRPLLGANLSVFWLIMLAALIRIGADAYGFVLIAFQRDTAIPVITVAGAIASAALNLALVPVLGLYGAAITYILTSVALLIARVAMSRPPQPNPGLAARIAKPAAAKSANIPLEQGGPCAS